MILVRVADTLHSTILGAGSEGSTDMEVAVYHYYSGFTPVLLRHYPGFTPVLLRF